MIKKFNRFMNTSILLSGLFFVIGIVFIALPKESIITISYVIATLIILYGLSLFIVDYKYGSLLFIDNFTNGVLSILFGLTIIFYPKIISTIIPIGLGVWFIISSLFKLRLSILIKNDTAYWVISLLLSILSILCGLILLINPFSSAVALTSLLGVLLIVYSISNICEMIILKRNVNDISKSIKKVFKSID